MGCIFEKLRPNSNRPGQHGPGFHDIIIMCGDKRLQPNPCRDCCIEADYLCDFPVGDDKTCDAKLCQDHAIEVAPNIHYCMHHYAEFQKFEKSGGVKKYLEKVIPFKLTRR